MKKLITVSVFVCIAIALVTAVALAQSDYVFNPLKRYVEIPVVSSDQNIIMDVGWVACRRGAVQNFLSKANVSWTLFLCEGSWEECNFDPPVVATGVNTDQYWGPIYEIPAEPGAEACMGKTPETVWNTHWIYNMGQLDPGNYLVDFVLWVDHPVTDVADYDGDGRPEVFRFRLHEGTELIVTE